jgi:hypothetical protein
MLFLSKAEVNKFNDKSIIDFDLGGESEQNVTPMDIHGTGNNVEHQDSQSKTNEANSNQNVVQPIKKSYITPKIWMDFEDFCSCFTSVIVYHNPRGYQYIHKHTEVKVILKKIDSFFLLILIMIFISMHICYSFSFLHLIR